MEHIASQPVSIDMLKASPNSRLERVSLTILRYSLVIMLLLGGLSKWTRPEADSIQPWMSHSPFLSFLYRFLSVQGASIAIGIVELSIAVLIACRRWLPRLCALGSALAVPMFLITLSLLATTPHLDGADQGFIMKDIFLLGVALWSLGESLRNSRSTSGLNDAA